MHLNVISKTPDYTGYNVRSIGCPKCGAFLDTVIPSQKLYLYNQGEPASIVLEHLSLEHREMFISGYCSECWDNLFPDDEEEEEE